MLFEKFFHEFLGGFCITLPLDWKVQNFAFIVEGAPKPIASFPNHNHHFIKVPVITMRGTGPA